MRRCNLILFIMLVPTLSHAGGWTQKKGASYVKLSLNSFSTREQFNLRGKREPLNTQFNLREAKFTDNNLSVYAEYGLTGGLTLVGNTSIKSSNASGFNSIDQQRYDNTISGLGDVYAGARLRLLVLPFALALQPMVKLPAGASGMIIPLGTGKADAELRLQMGAVLPVKIQNYFTADLGYTRRGGAEYNDEIPYLAEFGVFPVRDLIVKAQIDGRKSTESISDNMRLLQSNQNVLLVNQDFTRLWGGLIYRISPTTEISAEVSTAIAGRNAVAGRAIYLGIAFKTP